VYASSNNIVVIKSRKISWTELVASMREMRNSYNTLVGNPERKSPLVRRKRRWKYNIRMENRVGRCGMDASGLGKGPVADCCDLRVP
jgi:hypothetical protein